MRVRCAQGIPHNCVGVTGDTHNGRKLLSGDIKVCSLIELLMSLSKRGTLILNTSGGLAGRISGRAATYSG
ncbi:MAG: hypothetical protein GTO08_02580 [Deltaproteobacteria bacterium]|nr:hypothetical protein [Deltaproteobacteria bacterium]